MILGKFVDDSGYEITVEYPLVTPELAREWLAVNFSHNRPVNLTRVNDRVLDLREGTFLFNGDTVKFDCNGRLVDAQHRLWGIVKSGVSAHLLVVRGLAPEAIYTIDTNSVPRTIGHLMEMREALLKNMSYAVATQKILMNGDQDLKKYVTNKVKVAEMVQEDSDILVRWATWSKGLIDKCDILVDRKVFLGGRNKKAFSCSPLAALGVLMAARGVDFIYIDQFFRAVLLTREAIVDQSLVAPVNALRNYFAANPLVREGGSQLPILFRNYDTTIRTFNKWVMGEEIKIIRHSGGGQGIKWISEIEWPLLPAEDMTAVETSAS